MPTGYTDFSRNRYEGTCRDAGRSRVNDVMGRKVIAGIMGSGLNNVVEQSFN